MPRPSLPALLALPLGLLAVCLAVAPVRAGDDAPPAPAPTAPAPSPASPGEPPAPQDGKAKPDAPKPPAAEPPIDEAKRAAILAVVDELREEASKIRGLAWKTKVPADLISRAQLRRDLEQMIKDELKPDEYDRDVKFLRRLGLLKADEDPIEIEKAFLEQGIAGYFNPKTKRFYVIDGLTGDGQRPTILHELVHALEDQYIDLEKTQEAVEKDGDRSFALKCVIEGSAETARLAYQREHPEIARIAAKDQTKSAGSKDMATILAKTPALLILPTLLQYRMGPAFVRRAIGQDYTGGMARLYKDPPVSEEQVMHPGRFVGEHRDLPRKITWPKDLAETLGAGWKAHEESAVGELDFGLWLDRWLGAKDGRLDTDLMGAGRYWSKAAQQASEGWDGMVAQLLDEGGKARCYVVVSAWDTPADAIEAANALITALGKQHGSAFKASPGSPTAIDGDAHVFGFETPYGAGRISVDGDELRIVDGVPADAIDRVWDKVAAAKVERDPADTWTPATEPDAFAGTAWKKPDHGVGWDAPDATWTVTPIEGAAGSATLANAGLSARVETMPGGFQQNLLKVMVLMKQRHPKATLDLTKVEESNVGPKEAGRLVLPEGDVQHVVYLAPIGDALLLVDAVLPKEGAAAAEKELATLLYGFVFTN